MTCPMLQNYDLSLPESKLLSLTSATLVSLKLFSVENIGSGGCFCCFIKDNFLAISTGRLHILFSSWIFTLHISKLKALRSPGLEKFGHHFKTQCSLHIFEHGASFHLNIVGKYCYIMAFFELTYRIIKDR